MTRAKYNVILLPPDGADGNSREIGEEKAGGEEDEQEAHPTVLRRVKGGRQSSYVAPGDQAAQAVAFGGQILRGPIHRAPAPLGELNEELIVGVVEIERRSHQGDGGGGLEIGLPQVAIA